MKSIFNKYLNLLIKIILHKFGYTVVRIEKTQSLKSNRKLTNNNLLNICICQPLFNAQTETFIKAHEKNLPGNTYILYGGGIPRYTSDGLTLPEYYLDPETAFKKFIIKNRIDIVLAEYGPTGVGIIDICRKIKMPYVVHFHGYDAHSVPTIQKYLVSYRKMFFEASGLIAVSNFMKQQLISLGCPETKILVNPYGVDCSKFVTTKPSLNKPQIIAIGRFCDKKAPYLTILSFKQVLITCPDATLVMIGDGELLESSKQLANSLNLENSIKFLGVRDHSEIALILRESRIFVQHSLQTSYGDAEGTPVAILEAQACGLPIVSTKHAGICEAVIHAETGFLVNEGDVQEMAKYIVTLLTNTSLADKMGQNARLHMTDHYSMDKSISNLYEFLKIHSKHK